MLELQSTFCWAWWASGCITQHISNKSLHSSVCHCRCILLTEKARIPNEKLLQVSKQEVVGGGVVKQQ
jgi:hypothetical protein